MHDQALNDAVSYVPADSPAADAIRAQGIPTDTRLLKVSEAARVIGVHKRTLYGWIARGQVQTRYLPSGITLVVMSSIIKTEKPAAEPRQGELNGESGR